MEESRMGILGGLDVGFGANMQVVRTNYLCVKDSGAALTQNAANFLSLYNQHVSEQAFGNTGLTCDYILPMANQCSDAGTTSSDVVIETINGSALPVANQRANAASSNGYGIIAVLGVGAVEFTNATFTAGTAIASAVDANADLANSGLLLDMVGASSDGGSHAGMATTIDLSGIVADLLAACGTGTVALSDADLAAGTFVEKGNATGATAKTLADVTIGTNAAGVISVTTLCGVGYL